LKRHGLAGLALRAVEGGQLPADPAFETAARDQWRKDRKLAAVLGLESRRIGLYVKQHFANSELQLPVLLKGSAVAARYFDPTVRPFVDIDLLVPAEDLPRWGSIMRALGYTPENPWRERSAQRFDRHVAFRRPLGHRQILCEIHSRLSFDKTLQSLHYESLFGYTEPSAIPGLLQLRAPAQLVTLAVHLANHPRGSRRLIWYRDILELSKGSNVAKAYELASELGAEWALEWVLSQVEKMAAGADIAADPTLPQDKPFYRMLERYYGGPGYQFAVARELGIFEGPKFLASRIDPRRFLGNEGRFEPKRLRSWVTNLLSPSRFRQKAP